MYKDPRGTSELRAHYERWLADKLAAEPPDEIARSFRRLADRNAQLEDVVALALPTLGGLASRLYALASHYDAETREHSELVTWSINVQALEAVMQQLKKEASVEKVEEGGNG